jgi:hypothetical protein
MSGPLDENAAFWRDRIYAKGRRVSDQQLALVNLKPHDFHGEWNYTIRPTSSA